MKAVATIPKLAGSIVVDLIGMSSSAVPVIGGISDIFIAPLTAAYIKLAYPTRNGLAITGFVEEILFFDWIPTATITWFVERFSRE